MDNTECMVSAKCEITLEGGISFESRQDQLPVEAISAQSRKGKRTRSKKRQALWQNLPFQPTRDVRVTICGKTGLKLANYASCYYELNVQTLEISDGCEYSGLVLSHGLDLFNALSIISSKILFKRCQHIVNTFPHWQQLHLCWDNRSCGGSRSCSGRLGLKWADAAEMKSRSEKPSSPFCFVISALC